MTIPNARTLLRRHMSNEGDVRSVHELIDRTRTLGDFYYQFWWTIKRIAGGDATVTKKLCGLGGQPGILVTVLSL